jgi:hypothetical protein
MHADLKVFKIDSCARAVQVLSSKTQVTCAAPYANKQLASDPAVNLAKHLLASQLNAKAGACGASTVASTIGSAEKLLDNLDYLGCKLAAAPSAAQVTLLRSYATELDQYNNGNVCPGCHG